MATGRHIAARKSATIRIRTRQDGPVANRQTGRQASQLRIVTFTTLYPSAVSPRHGIFVEERLLQLQRSAKIDVRVIAPVPWFPFRSRRFGAYASHARTPKSDVRSGIEVAYPRYPAIPKFGMTLAPWLLAASQFHRLRRLRDASHDPLLIDAHYLYPDGVAASLLGHWLGLPVVLTARGSDVNVFTQYRLPRRAITQAISRSHRVVTVSEALRRRLLALGATPDKVVTLRNGVDLDRFRPLDRTALRAGLGFDGPTLLCVGNLVELKGHALAIDALAELPQVRLVIVGEGPLAQSLQSQANARGVAGRVEFHGNLPRDELVRFYNAADALLLPSSREGMPNVVLESLACGTPVLATDVGGVAEVVTGEAAGILIRERSAAGIVAAWRELQACRPGRTATRAYAETLGWEPTVSGLLRVFAGVSGS